MTDEIVIANFASTTPFRELKVVFEDLTEEEVSDMAEELAMFAQRVLRMSAYLKARAAGMNHKEAVTEQNRINQQVRTILGYSEKRNITF